MKLKILRLSNQIIETNCYIIEFESHLIIIDPAFYNESFNFLSMVDRKKSIYIFLTHNHYDHIAGVYELLLKLKSWNFKNIRLFIHHKDYKTLFDPLYNFSYFVKVEIKKFSITDIIKEEFKEINLNDQDKILIIHTPGHTEGSISILIGNNLFSGDTIFKQGIGRTDLPGGDFQKLCNSLKKLINFFSSHNQIKNIKIFPGHGQSTSLENEISSFKYYCSEV